MAVAVAGGTRRAPVRLGRFPRPGVRPCSLLPTFSASSTSWRPCARPTRAAAGISRRHSRRSRPIRSRKPMKSPTRSRGGDMADLRDELGDLLLQVAFHAQNRRRARRVRLRRRRRGDHGKDDPPPSACFWRSAGSCRPQEVKALWARIKAEEKAAKAAKAAPAGDQADEGLLDDIPLALPGLSRAVKLQNKASSVGFDWNDIRLRSR